MNLGMKRLWSTVGAVALLGVAACSPSGSTGSPSESATSAAPTSTAAAGGDARVRAAAETLVTKGGPPGVVVLVQSGTERHETVAGASDLSTGAPMSATLPFRIASVSKAYNGAVVLSLVSEGKLSLTDRLPKVWPQAPAKWRKVTVGQLLHHTSGLPDYIRDPKFVKEFVADPQMQRTPEELVGYVSEQPTEFRPGSEYAYSDTDNIVAGLVAEHVTGKTYSELLASQVTQPLNLSTTELPESTPMPDPYMHGYAVDPESPEPQDVSNLINPQLAWASGGMTTTVEELNTFFRANAAGKLFDQKVRKQQLQFVPGAGGPPGPGINAAGLGIYQYTTPCGKFLGHTGNLPGYTTFVGATEDGSDSVVVAVNRQITPKSDPKGFTKLVALENVALCSAVGRTG